MMKSSSCLLNALLSFLLGSLFAWLSQWLLQWANAHLEWSLLHSWTSSWNVMCFSLLWSVATCIILFAGLFLHSSVSRYLKDDDEEEENSSSSVCTELSFLFGALMTVTATWILQDNTLTEVEISSTSLLGIVLAASLTWSILMTLLLCGRSLCFALQPEPEPVPASSSPPPMKETCIYLSASLLGLVVGMGSQLILSLFLWNNDDRIPVWIQSNLMIALFSFGWSFLTVLCTWLFCYTLRSVITTCDAWEEEASSNLQKQRWQRMESIYIGCTLTGICLGWILLDLLHHMPSQIYISLALFVLSLSTFAAILYCFPDAGEEEDGKTDLTEPLLPVDEEMLVPVLH